MIYHLLPSSSMFTLTFISGAFPSNTKLENYSKSLIFNNFANFSTENKLKNWNNIFGVKNSNKDIFGDFLAIFTLHFVQIISKIIELANSKAEIFDKSIEIREQHCQHHHVLTILLFFWVLQCSTFFLHFDIWWPEIQFSCHQKLVEKMCQTASKYVL